MARQFAWLMAGLVARDASAIHPDRLVNIATASGTRSGCGNKGFTDHICLGALRTHQQISAACHVAQADK
jgi:hypothetical protein